MISIGMLLKNTWQIYKAHFKLFAEIVLPAIILSIVFYTLYFFQLTSLFIYGLLTNIVEFFVGLWIIIALVYILQQREKKVSAKDTLEKTWRLVLSYWRIIILSALITVGGFLLFLVPGVVLSVWFSLVVYVLVLERRRGMTALLRSRHLVLGYWWPVFLRFLILSILAILITGPFSVAGIIATIGFTGVTLVEIAEVAEGINRIVIFPAIVVGWLFTIFVVIYTYLIYENLRDLKKDIPFEEPSRGVKLKYLSIGIVGIFWIPVIIIIRAISVL